MENLTIEILAENTEYSLQPFDCGEASLNLFLTEHLRRQHSSKLLRAYVLRTSTPECRVLGYYTLSGSCFERASLPSKTQQKRIPYKNIPGVTLGRLAVDLSLQGEGWGSVLVTHAMKVVWSASMAVGIHGLFVEALNEKALAFYLSLGFIPLSGENKHALFYPTKSIEQLFG
ncbi:N-acetyltransferase [Pluralibacter sp.]|uniref:GNAT family N-acetyltransferase n=1 Tax=Pluralibacter sp. TaxID=1920032 RepID=UPI0025CD7D78|nr:GNAT family N-acetyltransferase [Pluralibacter sp.]MBV8045492.1 GNAT family N-acetyltransferase [Pluralibacter sp.]